jgi:tetratricopeptide (TPR) repeat protein
MLMKHSSVAREIIRLLMLNLPSNLQVTDQAQACCNNDDWREAIACCQRQYAEAKDGLLPEVEFWEGILHMYKGAGCYAEGYPASAVRFFSRSAQIFEGMNHWHGQGIALMSLGEAYRALKDSQKALRQFKHACRIFQQLESRYEFPGSVTTQTSREAASAVLEGNLLSLQRELAKARENLRVIRERMAEFVLSTDIPLQLVKDERRWLDRIADLERKVSTQSTKASKLGLRRNSIESAPEQSQGDRRQACQYHKLCEQICAKLRSMINAIETPEHLHLIPLPGTVAAGEPVYMPNEDSLDQSGNVAWEDIIVGTTRYQLLTLKRTPKNDHRFTSNDKYFISTVRGDSMIGENIHSGDLLLVKRQDAWPELRQIAVFEEEGRGPVVKRFYRTENRIYLESANPNYMPRQFGKNSPTLRLLGVVVAILQEKKG